MAPSLNYLFLEGKLHAPLPTEGEGDVAIAPVRVAADVANRAPKSARTVEVPAIVGSEIRAIGKVKHLEHQLQIFPLAEFDRLRNSGIQVKECLAAQVVPIHLFTRPGYKIAV